MNPSRAAAPETLKMVILAIAAAGFSTVDVLTATVIPITCRHFTDNAFLIAAILATNRLFGFLVLPYVCWKSDHVRTRFGRRRPFLVAGLALTLAAVLLVGLLPIVFVGAARHTLPALLVVIVLNVVLQAVLDINWGAIEPLYADSFRQEQLGRASGFRHVAAQLAAFAMMSHALAATEQNEFYPYMCAAIAVAVSLALILFAAREPPPGPPQLVTPYNPLGQVRLLMRNPEHRRIAFLCAANLVLPAVLFLFTPLHVTETLALTAGELGCGQLLGVFLLAALALPTGWLVDRFGCNGVTTLGFSLFAVCFTALAFWVKDFWTFFAVMALFGVAQALTITPMSAMIFQNAGSGERGRVYGAVQLVRGFSAFAVTLVLGWCVQHLDNNQPVPLHRRDIKDVSALAAKLHRQTDPASAHLWHRLSETARRRLQQYFQSGSAQNSEAITQIVIAELNAIIFARPLHHPEAFAAVALSPQSARLLARPSHTQSQSAVLNRSLLCDAFSDAISRKPDYQFSYHVGLVLSLLAIAACLWRRQSEVSREDRLEPGNVATVASPAAPLKSS